MAHQWLPAALAIGLFGLVASLAVAYPRRPGQLSLVVFALLAIYVIWMGCSAIWAGSPFRVWMETLRTGGLLLAFVLALVYLTDAGARRWFRYLFLGAALFLLAGSVIQLYSTGSIESLFVENRFFFPVTYPNNAAALFLVCFWPLMWLAAGPEERAPVRGLALGLATGMLGLTMLTQSRGAIWSLGLSVILALILFPARLRILLYLGAPILLLVYEFPTLNSYWAQGPAAVGGGPGARTLLVAVIATAFVGMILALLERWIRVSGKAKVVIGSMVFVAIVAGSVFGMVTLTKDAGGPAGWISQTWKEFTGQAAPHVSESDSASRFIMATSSGRVEIWKVAWQSLAEEPALGVGADNYVFQHDRLRKTDSVTSLHAHSIGLQVLGETGIIGGVIAFGAILLALGGIMWPRWAAAWRRARSTWLRRPRAAEADKETEQDEAVEVLEGNGAAAPTRSRSWFSSARWGDDPLEYGWQMGLLLGVLYWLIHANVDWLWQMTGVALPMLLLLAAAIAEVDGRAGILWPRWNRWLRVGGEPTERPDDALDQASVFDSADDADHSVALASAATSESVAVAADETVLAEKRREPDGVFYSRRADRHEARRRRRDKRRERAAHLQPPGALSHVFRTLLVLVSLAVLITAGLSYLAIQYQDSALALARTDAGRAVDRADTACWFQPSSPVPYETQAGIYHLAALMAAESLVPDRAGAVLDDLALALERWEKATLVESVDWSIHYHAGVAAINLALATAYAFDHDPAFIYADWADRVPGLDEWETSLRPADRPAPPGEALDSLAQDPPKQAIAAEWRVLGSSEILVAATEFLVAAGERNPLDAGVIAAEQLVEYLKLTLAE